MLVDRMHAALADQANEMNARVGRDRPLDLLDPGAIRKKTSVLDRFVDANEILHHDSTRAKVEVANLAVSDLACRQADGEPRCLEKRLRITAPELVPGWGRRHGDRVPFALSPVSPAVENHQDYGFLSHEGR